VVSKDISAEELKRLGRHTIRWVPVTESVDEQKSAAHIFRSSARNSRKTLAREALERSSQELGAQTGDLVTKPLGWW
jgi:hypothetical protein